MNASAIIVAGIDVSKANLDVDLAPQPQPMRFGHDQPGIDRLIDWLKQQRVTRVVVEATGGLERRLARRVVAAGLTLCVVNPRQVRDFARATGQLAKTDAIDAAVIAQMGHKLKLRVSELPCETRETLIAAATRDRQLSDMLVAERNRLERTDDPDMIALIQQTIEHLDQQRRDVQAMMDKLIASHATMKNQADAIASTPGIGTLTAHRLVAHLPELGGCNRQQIARLVGLAPVNRDSGTMRGKRTTGGGRKHVRTLLYMPTVVAIKHNAVIRAVYQSLLARGKPKMVALVAAMRKLIIMLNAMLKQNKTWPELVGQA